MRIGQMVKRHLGAILTYCEAADHGELDRLLDASYSKETFGLNFPFCAELERMRPEDHRRYWTQVYLVRGRQVRVTSQWFEPHRDRLADYLVSRDIAAVDQLGVAEPPTVASSQSHRDSRPTRARSDKANARYRGNAIGNAQNAFVRNVLSNLGHESFSERDWTETRQHFGGRCAYCGVEAERLLMEHAIPINRVRLGEHRLGNLVPSCERCNSAKGDRDFREFLSGNVPAIARIEQYMDSHNYVPLENNEQVTKVLNLAHAEVAELARRYVTILNELFVQPTSTATDDEPRRS